MAWSQSKKPDPILVNDQLQAMQNMFKAWGVEYFCRHMFWVLPKKKEDTTVVQQASLVPFRFNRIQQDLFENLALRNLLLKARQIGGTTFFLLVRLLLPAIIERGISSLLISQNAEYAGLHFQIARRAYRYIGILNPYDMSQNDLNISLRENLLHTEYSNRRELVFDQIESRVMVATAEVEESAQGTTLHHILADEYSRWPGKPEDTLSNVMGALVPGGTLDKNCTANGAAGPFYEDCLRAMNDATKSDARFHYYSWWWSDEYVQDLSEKQAKELEADLDATERLILKKIHAELADVTWHSGMKKMAWRRSMKLSQRGNFDEKYPEDALTAFLVMGKQYFDGEILRARKLELTGYQPVNSFSNGQAKIFRPRVANRRYVIGADPKKGIEVSTEDTDFAAAVVLDLETGEEMAGYRARVAATDLAYDLADLGRYYNNAIIAVERVDGGATILTLNGECKYPSIYRHRDWWRRERQLKFKDFEGFPTTPKTRPVALDFLNRFVMEHPELIWDEQFINEALTFVRDEKGVPAAAPAAYDDTVSARWIAHYVRKVLLGYWEPEQPRSERYVPADRLTDLASTKT